MARSVYAYSDDLSYSGASGNLKSMTVDLQSYATLMAGSSEELQPGLTAVEGQNTAAQAMIASLYAGWENTDASLSSSDQDLYTAAFNAYDAAQTACESLGFAPPSGFNAAIDSIGTTIQKAVQGTATALEYVVIGLIVVIAGIIIYKVTSK